MTTDKRHLVLSTLVLTAAALGVAPLAAQQQVPAATPVLTGPAMPEMPANLINMVLVTVEGDPIMMSDLLELEEQRIPLLLQQFPEAEVRAVLPQLRMDLLGGLIEARVIQKRAERMGITVDANMVDRQMQALREQNGFTDDAAFEAALAESGTTLAVLREQMRDSLVQQRLVFEEVQRSIFVSENDITTYYDENREQYRAPAQVRLEQVIFLGAPNSLEADAQAAVADLVAGADPATVADRYATAQHFPVDTGIVPVDDLNESLRAAVPLIEPGNNWTAVRTDFGYSVVRVAERTDTSISPIDDVRDDIRERLLSTKSAERMERYLRQIWDETHVEFLDARLAVLSTRWETPETDQANEGIRP